MAVPLVRLTLPPTFGSADERPLLLKSKSKLKGPGRSSLIQTVPGKGAFIFLFFFFLKKRRRA